MEYLESASVNPAWNLALEEFAFERMDRAREYLIFWRNDRTVIVGKNQNTVQEINGDYVRRHGIRVVRRLSGGGAVYQDLGNLNFTFIADAGGQGKIDFRTFCVPVVETLRSFGVPAELNGRNDLTVEGRKFSGNAQYVRNHRVMHHGTLLFDSNLEIMERALRVAPDKIASKGIASVRSRVANLREYLGPEVTLQMFQTRLLDALAADRPLHRRSLSEEERQQILEIRRRRYDTWTWNYGRSPAYTVRRSRRFEGCGQVEVTFSVKEGRVQDLRFFGDFFGNGDTEALAERLRGCRCRRGDILERLEECDPGWYINRLTASELSELICP